jgi:nitrate/nitrite transport system ATP-binding protein
MNMRPLEITSLTKSFGSFVAVKDFSVKIKPGEFVALLGHSGCGKSTVLSIIAGLQNATLGGVVIDGHEIDGPALDRALVFQSPSLLPWLSAIENVILAVRQSHPKLTAKAQREMARKYLELVGITEFADQMPGELSQGTQQRVSIARAFSQEPRFLLLDEPFGMLDSMTRFELQDLVVDLWQQHPKTVVMVTHDVDEALFLSDRIILMTDGPEAKLGIDLKVDLPRPRDRRQLASDARYFELREQVIGFLEHHSKQFAEVAA